MPYLSYGTPDSLYCVKLETFQWSWPESEHPNINLLCDILSYLEVYYVMFKFYDPRWKYSQIIVFIAILTDKHKDTHADLVKMINCSYNELLGKY